jgi:hypothetical protein
MEVCNLSKIRGWFEWLEHGKTAFDIVIALGGSTVIRALLLQFTRLPSFWITPIWLISASAILWLMVAFVHKKIFFPQQPDQSTDLASVDLSVKEVNDLFGGINPRFRDDIEKAVRTQVERVPTGAERETYMIRGLVLCISGIMLEGIWNGIFRSQILALQKLNDGGLKRDGVFPFYTKAAADNPAVYKDYTFDQWLGYMRSQTLIREDGDIINITVKGQSFLKFLLDDHRSAAGRAF